MTSLPYLPCHDDSYAAQDGEEYVVGETQVETQPSQPFSQTQRTGTQSQHQRVDRRPPLPPTWALLVPKGPRAQFQLLRGQDEYVVGRNNKGRGAADLILEDKKVSGRHALISRVNEQTVILVDYSTNGTWLNGNRLIKGARMQLNKADEVCFGPPNNDVDDLAYVFLPTSAGWTDAALEEKAGGLYKHYELREQIGKGSFATVKAAIQRSTGKTVAVKIINKKRFQANEKTMEMLRREVEIYKGLKHPYIASYEDYFEDDSYMYTVLEYVDGGDLLEYVTNQGGLSAPQLHASKRHTADTGTAELNAQEFSRQVCTAVAYLHSQGVAHRDLKPDNLLLTSSEPPVCKVTDFGLAKLANDMTFLRTMCGTPSYLAPEVILQEEQQGYDFACDAWSIGVLVYAALANALPFEEDEKEDLRARMARRRPDMDLLRNLGISESGQDFVARLMTFDPKHRMTAAQALEHPWLRAAIQRASSGEISTLPAAIGGRASPIRGGPAVRASVSTEPGTDLHTPSDRSRDSYAAKLGDLNITSPIAFHNGGGSVPFATDLEEQTGANGGGWDTDTAAEDQPQGGVLGRRGTSNGVSNIGVAGGQKRKAHPVSAFSSASASSESVAAGAPPRKKANTEAQIAAAPTSSA